MTITAPDFEHQIDAAPRGDPDVRHAYADWLEDNGDSAGARFQRWMGEHVRAAEEFETAARTLFRWYCSNRDRRYEPVSVIPRAVYLRFNGHLPSLYDSREAAEQALRTALESVDYEVTW